MGEEKGSQRCAPTAGPARGSVAAFLRPLRRGVLVAVAVATALIALPASVAAHDSGSNASPEALGPTAPLQAAVTGFELGSASRGESGIAEAHRPAGASHTGEVHTDDACNEAKRALKKAKRALRKAKRSGSARKIRAAKKKLRKARRQKREAC